MKLIRDDYELKTCQEYYSIKDILGNNPERLLIYGTQNEITRLED